MAIPRTLRPAPASSTGWYPVARSADVGTTPLPVGAGGQAYVVVRLRRGGEVTALSARCPHRLVPLATATVVDGRLQCPDSGWQWGAEGRCVLIPSLGADGTPPPRADLSAPWAVEERDGWVWLAPDPTPVARPPRGTTPVPEPAPAPPAPRGPVFGNLEPSLEHAWHPVALSSELLEGGYAQVRLLGRTWTVHRRHGEVDADPPAWGVTERYGVIWIAPAEPRDELVDVPEATDPGVTAVWLMPARSVAPAALLVDALLDGALPDADVAAGDGGFRAVQGHRTAIHRAPFQLRLEERDGSAVRTVLSLLQPEDADSTRVYTCLLLSGPGALPRDVVAAEVALQQAALAEDLARPAALAGTGLPLLLRDEVHVPADRLGVALRRALADFAADGAAADRTAALRERATG